jgi:hypothetical protein
VRSPVCWRGNSSPGETFQIRSRAEGTTLAPENGDVSRVICVEREKGFLQRICMIWIDGIPRLGARQDDCLHTITVLNSYGHCLTPLKIEVARFRLPKESLSNLERSLQALSLAYGAVTRRVVSDAHDRQMTKGHLMQRNMNAKLLSTQY